MVDDVNRLPDDDSEVQNNPEISEHQTGKHRHRRRVKTKKRVKQRVRVKKKPSVKKRLKRILSYLAWFVVIGGFLITVFILVKELDIKDENAKKQAPKKKQVYHLPNKMRPVLLATVTEYKKVIHFTQTENITALNSLT